MKAFKVLTLAALLSISYGAIAQGDKMEDKKEMKADKKAMKGKHHKAMKKEKKADMKGGNEKMENKM